MAAVAWSLPRRRARARAASVAKSRGRIPLRPLTLGALAVLIAGAGASAVTTYLEHRAADDLRASITQLQPARDAAAELGDAYAAEKLALQSYLASGAKPLGTAVVAARSSTETLLTQLRAPVGVDSEASTDLTRLASAGTAWQDDVVHRALAARKHGALSASAAKRWQQRVTNEFARDTGVQLSALTQRLEDLQKDSLAQLSRAQYRADLASYLALGFALLVAALTVLVLRRLFTGPLEQLVVDVNAIADGEFEHEVTPGGAREIALAGRAVAHMRDQFMRNSRRLVDAQRVATMRSERDRMAADLHDLTLQDVYAIGLGLEALAMRHPAAAADLDVLAEDVRRMDRELRAVVFAITEDPDTGPLSAVITQLVVDSRRALGFAPALSLHGAVDLASGSAAGRQLLAALRESLSNVARHAHATSVSVTIALTGGGRSILRMVVTDDGIGTSGDDTPGNGLRNLIARAESHGGEATVMPVAGGGTSVDWWVPVTE